MRTCKMDTQKKRINMYSQNGLSESPRRREGMQQRYVEKNTRELGCVVTRGEQGEGSAYGLTNFGAKMNTHWRMSASATVLGAIGEGACSAVRVCFPAPSDTFVLSRDGPMLTSFNLFEIAFRPMVNKGIARGVRRYPPTGSGAERFLSGRRSKRAAWEDGSP